MTTLLIILLSFCQPCLSSDDGVKFIQKYEGYVPVMYQDAVGYWTIGYGHLMSAQDIIDYKGVTLTAKAGDALFRKDLSKFERGVNLYVNVPLLQTQFDAVVSFSFNVGMGNFQRSTLRRKLNLELHNEVPPEFLRWDKAAGRVLLGLTRRRLAESIIYAQPNEDELIGQSPDIDSYRAGDSACVDVHQ